jgi:hypothetical protein
MIDRSNAKSVRGASLRKSRTVENLLPFGIALVLLVGIGADRLFLQPAPADPTAYHVKISKAAGDLPYSFDQWRGVDVPVPPSAVAMLKPNVIISRRYRQSGSNREVGLLLVQCSDARDILGHFPPVCYRSNGCTEDSREQADWTVDGLTVTGMRYFFTTPRHTQVTVDNFLLLPNGKIARDMDAIQRAAKDRRQKYFGAAQVQVVYDQDIDAQERAEITSAFVRMLSPVIDAIIQRPQSPENSEKMPI